MSYYAINKDRILNYAKNYYNKNKEQRKLYMKKYREEQKAVLTRKRKEAYARDKHKPKPVLNEQQYKERLVKAAKTRAKTSGLPFSLVPGTMVWPTHCPCFGTELTYGVTNDLSKTPSIDKIDPTKGYTMDNVQVISWKANIMKSNASKEELIKFCEWVNLF